MISPRSHLSEFHDRRESVRRHRAGFTLIELIVVIVILGVLAGAIAPSLLRSGERYAELEAQAAQRLLTVAAERDSLSTEPLAIEYDDNVGELRLLVRRINTTGVAGANAKTDTAWQPDPLAQTVVFSKAKLTQATSDGRPLPRQKWRIVFSQAAARPALALTIDPRGDRVGGGRQDPSSKLSWQITLAPEASAAVRIGGTSSSSAGRGAFAAADRSIDLDAAGKGEKPW